MSFLTHSFEKLFAGRKGRRGNRRLPSRKVDRRLTLEHMESRVMMSANPLCNAAIHSLDQIAAPALVAYHLPGGKPHPLILPPAAPTLTGTALSTSQIKLSWTSTAGATKYQVQELMGTTWTTIHTGSSTSYVDSKLNPSTSYQFQVLAVGSSGLTTPSNSVTITTNFVAPAAPTLTGTAVSASQINLTWTNGTNATTYEIFAMVSGPYGIPVPMPIGQVTGVSSFQVNQLPAFSGSGFQEYALSANTSYTFWVQAINPAGAATGNTVTVLTFPAAPVINGEYGYGDPNYVSWNVVPGAASYSVQVLVNGAWTPIAGQLTYVPAEPGVPGGFGPSPAYYTYGFTNFNPGAPSYEFRVGATNASGTSWSTPLVLTPTNL